jgi:hypothetical protein
MNRERLKGIASGLAVGVLGTTMLGGGVSADAATQCDWSHQITSDIPANPNMQTIQNVSREFIKGDITFVDHPEQPDSNEKTFQEVIIELPVPASLRVVAPWGGTRFAERACATTGQWETVIGHEQRVSLFGRSEDKPTVLWAINRP